MLKIVYAGTPEFAVPGLEALLHSEHRVLAVYTQPDRPAGRGRKLQPSPVKRLALAHGIEVCQPQNFKSTAEVERLRGFDADLMVVAAYGLLLPASILAAPRLGCVNIHASLLPRWRGASPIQQAILAGDAESGITLIKMDEGLDTGDMIARRALTIGPGWSAGELHDALAPLGAELLLETLVDLSAALRRAQPQDDTRATFAPRLTKRQAQVDWQKPAELLEREVRAFNPWPVSFTVWQGQSLRLWRAHAEYDTVDEAPGRIVGHDRHGIRVSCGEGVLIVTELQFPGRKRCGAAEALNSKDLTGERLGEFDGQ